MKLINTTLAAGTLLLATSAHSIMQSGTDVTFEYDETTLFGEGTVVGNSIFFTPDAFSVESLNVGGPVTLSDTLNIDIVATTEGFDLTEFLLIENGDYRQKGVGANVDADAFFQATSNTKGLFDCGGGSCQDSFIASADPLADTGGALALWSLGGNINLADTVGWGTDTSVNITLQNNLLAETSADGEIAFIQKKFGAIGITVVPVPAAAWLFGSGLIGLVFAARRRKQ